MSDDDLNEAIENGEQDDAERARRMTEAILEQSRRENAIRAAFQHRNRLEALVSMLMSGVMASSFQRIVESSPDPEEARQMFRSQVTIAIVIADDIIEKVDKHTKIAELINQTKQEAQ